MLMLRLKLIACFCGGVGDGGERMVLSESGVRVGVAVIDGTVLEWRGRFWGRGLV